MSNSLLLIVFAVALGASGQISLKAGMAQVGLINSQALAQPVAIATRVFTTPLVVAGLACYALSAVVWLVVLSRVPVSFAYPMVAVSYVITTVLALVILGENVPSMRWMGLLTICLGVFLVSQS